MPSSLFFFRCRKMPALALFKVGAIFRSVLFYSNSIQKRRNSGEIQFASLFPFSSIPFRQLQNGVPRVFPASSSSSGKLRAGDAAEWLLNQAGIGSPNKKQSGKQRGGGGRENEAGARSVQLEATSQDGDKSRFEVEGPFPRSGLETKKHFSISQ